MRPLTLAEVAIATGGRVIADESAPTGGIGLSAIATDTRGLVAGAARILFVALRGEQFDGHDHVAAAEAAGVRALLVSRQVTTSLPQVVVADTTRALADLAAFVQQGRDGKVLAGFAGSVADAFTLATAGGMLSAAGIGALRRHG